MLDIFSEHVGKNDRILDFGCGYGRTLHELDRAGFTDLTGIDFSSTLIERGKKAYPTLNLTAYPGGPLPYEDGSFDAIVVLGVFTCMPETKTQAETLIELKRVLRPGGVLYVNDFLLNHDQRNLDRYKKGQEQYGIYGVFQVEDGGVLRHHDRNHMEALFRGCDSITFEEVTYDTMHGNRSQGFYALLRIP